MPIISQIEKELGKIDLANGMTTPQHPNTTVSNARKKLETVDAFQLTAIESLASGLKSLVLPLVLVHSVDGTKNSLDSSQEFTLTATEAIAASRLEEEHQIDEWGLVEGGHDIDRANLQVQVCSALLFLRLNSL